MANRLTRKLSVGKKALLAGAAVLVVIGPIAIGLVNPPRGRAQSQPAISFEVASVRPAPNAPRILTLGLGQMGLARVAGSQFEYTGTVYSLIVQAFRPGSCQYPDCVSGGPSWIRDDMYRIDAKLPQGVERYSTWEYTRGRAEGIYRMLQALLAERFSLKAHRETKQLPVYVMTVAAGGHKLSPTAGRTKQDSDGVTRLDENAAIQRVGGSETGVSRMTVTNFTAQQIADVLPVDRPVLDRTGLSGRFDFTFE